MGYIFAADSKGLCLS